MAVMEQELHTDVEDAGKIYPDVRVAPEYVSKLGMAYYGLPELRQNAVDAVVKEQGITRAQATLNEIIGSRIELYARGGEAEQKKVLEDALQILLTHGTSEDEARKRLGLGERP